MEQKAIEHIENNAAAVDVGSRLAASDMPIVVLPNTHSIMSIEKYQDAPARFRGVFSTRYLGDFAEYVKSANDGDSCVFVDAEKMSAQAIIDLGRVTAPLHGDHQAVLTLTPTPEYKALLAITSKPQGQRELAEWVEDWRSALTAHSEGDVLPEIKNVIKAIRSLKIESKTTGTHTADNLKASKGSLEEIEAKSGHETLPDFIVMSCVPYEGLALRDFVCRLGVLTSAEKPQYVLRITLFEREVEMMGKELQDAVKFSIAETIPVRLGKFTK